MSHFNLCAPNLLIVSPFFTSSVKLSPIYVFSTSLHWYEVYLYDELYIYIYINRLLYMLYVRMLWALQALTCFL